MDNERIREICMALPHVSETVNWGHHLVYWAGDRDIGGKMFAMTDLDGTGTGVLVVSLRSGAVSRAAGEGRNYRVALSCQGALGDGGAMGCAAVKEVEEELRRAHALIFEKLPKRTKTVLAMPEKERAKVIRERKKTVKAKAKRKRGSFRLSHP